MSEIGGWDKSEADKLFGTIDSPLVLDTLKVVQQQASPSPNLTNTDAVPTKEQLLQIVRQSLSQPAAAQILKNWESDIEALTPNDLQTVSQLAKAVGQFAASPNKELLKSNFDKLLEPYQHNPKQLVHVGAVAGLEAIREGIQQRSDFRYNISAFPIPNQTGSELQIWDYGPNKTRSELALVYSFKTESAWVKK